MSPARASLTSALLLALALAPGCTRAADPHDGELVVVVLVDTLRRDALGCYGRAGADTPRIDRLAAEGVRFDQAISASGWTLPSVASLLTGTWPTLHKATGKLTRMTPITEDLPVAAEVFHQAGWGTLAYVNAAFLSPLLGLNRGFDVFDHVHAFNKEIRRADATVDAALGGIAERPGQDLFVLVHLFDAHLDYDAPAPYTYEFTGGRTEPAAPLSMQACRALGDHPAQADVDHVRGLYQGEVAFVDRAVGRLVDGLRELGRWDRTTLVLTADHGEEFWDHHGFEHGHTLYDELIRVPLVVRLPGGVDGGRVVADQVRVLDVMPTLFELEGLEAPVSFAGRSLKPLLDGAADEPRIAFSQGTLYGSDKLSWRTAQYQLIQDRAPDAAKPFELYDWTVDPACQHDLAAEQPELVRRLYAELSAFHGDLEQRAKFLSTPEIKSLHPRDLAKYEASMRALGYTGRDEEHGDAHGDE
ncbi:MAG: sulfatase [Planctomycetes bacterium]|nr:sulfatase [Planctomycetota bacterium]